jgi:SPFH domain / Band 7 family
MPGWVIFVVVAAVAIVVVTWLLFDNSFVRIEPGHLGLLLVQGRATDKVLRPGPHIVLAIRRRMVETYPSLELAYRAGGAGADTSDLEHAGPAVRGVLGDRTAVVVSYTVRFRLDLSQLRSVHERFGPGGIWSAARDLSSRAVRSALCDEGRGVDDLFGEARHSLEADLGTAVGQALGAEGLTLVLFALDDVDLGRTGEVIQSTARARFGLAREEAEAPTRVAQARHDAELESTIAGTSIDSALRYREVDVWHDVALTLAERGVVLPGALAHSPGGDAPPDEGPEAAAPGDETSGP